MERHHGAIQLMIFLSPYFIIIIEKTDAFLYKFILDYRIYFPFWPVIVFYKIDYCMIAGKKIKKQDKTSNTLRK